ncbi:DsbA family protein [Thermobifida halotolerans]|uniref:DsbA family protein n=1 Tax=Thermobifida halotolerans TaxID=483545 RepID=UPI001F31AA85|nr:thioredoxin domain-containing protein [Thermobifida halotolerans]
MLAAALLLVAVAAVVRVVDWYGDGAVPSTAASPSPSGSVASPPVLRGPVPPEVETALTLGSAEAPVTMVVFSDYQCPYCATFATEQQPVLVRDYVETGLLRLVWRDYPYLGEESVRAAVAARAAARQGDYWDYHEALYVDPDAWIAEGASTESLVRVAAEAGLDTDRFVEDMADPALREAVRADFDFGLGLGVPGTPAFLINGTAFFGAQPIERFAEQIEAASDQAD